MPCGLCGTDIQPGVLTCPRCEATYGPTLTRWGLAMFVPAFLLLFAGFMQTGLGLLEKHNPGLIIGVLCLAAGAWILWTIKRKTPRAWRKTESF
jgi:protein-S-isoprenylcysteine O-methyltransferase Ste14